MISISNCQKKVHPVKPVSDHSLSNDTVELIKKHLKLQEMYELPENDTDVSHLYRLTDTDYELGGYAVSRGLKSSGYLPVSDDEFDKKINLFFEASPDCRLTEKKEHQKFYTFLINHSHEKDIAQTEYDYTYDHIFVFPEFHVVTTVPVLNGMVKVEGHSLKFTVDQNTIARNKYLFNNSRGDLAWLLMNDKEFLKSLLVVFGYDKEGKINQFVLDDLYRKYSEEIPFGKVAKMGEIFFVKDCSGKLKIREGLLTYVSNHTDKDDDRFVYALSSYLDYLFNEDKEHLFNEDLRQKFTLEEKAKIVAYVANLESPAFYKYKWIERPLDLEPQKAWNNAATALYHITAGHPVILKIIKENNYYGLEPLKKAIESEEFVNEATNYGLPSNWGE